MATQTPAEKKAKLLKELEGLGITATSGTPTITPLTGSETNDDLAALVKKAKAEAKAEAPTGPVTVTYLDHEGKQVSRVFSPEVHGADFVKFAEEFKKTNAARIVPDAPATPDVPPAATAA